MSQKPYRKLYSAKPFWAWNGKLDKEELIRQIHVMKEMGFGGFFMHSRTGLATEYLGDEWFELINACADEAEKLDMEAWLYDEDRWPSGSAGGIATKEIKRRMQYLRMNVVISDTFEWSNEIISAFAANVKGINYTDSLQITRHTDISALSTKHIIYFTKEYMEPSDNYNGSAYLDTMSKDAVEYYLSTTHDRYAEKCGERLGKSIAGIFTDEPHRGAVMSGFSNPNRDAQNLCPYTDLLFEEFEKAFGYKLESRLPELFLRHDEEIYSQVKWHYCELLTRLFISNFAKPCHKNCKQNNMLLTGHILHEDNLSCQTNTMGSVMRYYEHMDYPGIDVLTEQNKCYCIAKQISSAARQNGQRMILSELDGCTGWQMTFDNYKNIGDWQAIMGITLRCPHLSWYTMLGEAKRDYPASILHQSSWYKVYSVLEDYYARINEITVNSSRKCKTAVLMPVESVWAQIYAGWASGMATNSPEVIKTDKMFSDTYNMLLRAHIDFDYADEAMLAEKYTIEGKTLYIGKAEYDTVIISGMATMRSSTLDILKKFKENGGEVIFIEKAPWLIDALPNNAAAKFTSKCKRITIEGINSLKCDLEISSPEIMLQTYKDDNYIYYFLLNTNRKEEIKNVKVNFDENSLLREWNMLDGSEMSLESENGIIDLNFAPGQIHVIADCCNNIELANETEKLIPIRKTYAKNTFNFITDEPNVLVLDRPSFQINDGEINEPEEVLLADMKIRDILGLTHRGGSMLQPWYSEKQINQPKGSVSLYYSFEAEYAPEKVWLMMEEPQNFEITINGIKLAEKPENEFFIDICFTRFEISKYISDGINVICLTTNYKENSNLEAIYLLGDFGVSIPDMTITEPNRNPEFGSLVKQGYPFYGGMVSYELDFDIHLNNDEEAFLVLGAYENASCFEINGKIIPFYPYECKVTDTVIKEGKCKVNIYLSRRNMFWPLHGIEKHPLAIGPESFLNGGKGNEDYILFDSGIPEPPYIEIRKKEVNA